MIRLSLCEFQGTQGFSGILQHRIPDRLLVILPQGCAPDRPGLGGSEPDTAQALGPDRDSDRDGRSGPYRLLGEGSARRKAPHPPWGQRAPRGKPPVDNLREACWAEQE